MENCQIRGGAATESDWVDVPGGRNADDVKRRTSKAEIDGNANLDRICNQCWHR